VNRSAAETKDQIERYMANPERCMPSERARLEEAGFKASKRGTGRTTQQMRDAPYGACFVWCTEQLGYPRRLAMWLQRGDLTIIPPSQDLDDFHRGTTWAVVRDHACSH